MEGRHDFQSPEKDILYLQRPFGKAKLTEFLKMTLTLLISGKRPKRQDSQGSP
jgi:hypothetical protein